MMRVTLSTLFIVLLFTGKSQVNQDSLEQFTKDQLKNKSYPENVQFAIGVIDGKDRITFGFEKTDEWKEVNNASSIFEIGSISKVFTSFLLTRAAEAELLNITDTIQHDLAISWKVEQPITYEMLANHTSGLPRIPSNLLKDAMLHPENPYARYNEEDLIKYLEKKMKLEAEPGTEYAYSNLGAGLLAYLVCKKLDLSYEEALQKMILNVLEMEKTTTDLSVYNDETLVQGLNKKGKPVSHWDFKVMVGAGAIKSNVKDMLTFMYSQLNDNIVEIDMLQKKTFEGDPFDLALGWHIIPDEEWLWHNGGTGGFKSSLVLDPDTKKGVVILTNISAGHKNARFIDELGFMLLKRMNSK